MKKGVLILVLAGLSCLIFSSCSSANFKQFVFDDTVPTEQLTEIEMNNVGTIVGYNGIAVDWKPSGIYIVYIVKVPAGDTLFEINVDHIAAGAAWRGKGALFRYNFLPNKKYTVRFSDTEGVWGLKVYTYEVGEKMPISFSIETTDPHFTAFVPFLNAQGTQKTVLE
jgi:hypothetical protein